MLFPLVLAAAIVTAIESARDMATTWRSIWKVRSGVQLQTVSGPESGAGVVALPGFERHDGAHFWTLVRLSFETDSPQIEDAFVISSDLMHLFADKLCLSTFAHASVAGHVVTAPHVTSTTGFEWLTSNVMSEVSYSQSLDPSVLSDARLSSDLARALRLFRSALTTVVKSEALFLLYRSLETLAETEADENLSECAKCKHRTPIGKKTKQKILEWLGKYGCDAKVAKEFVDRVRNKVAHGSNGHTAAEEDVYTVMYSLVAPIAAEIIRGRCGIPAMCGENLVVKRPYVIHRCAYPDDREGICDVGKVCEAEVCIMRVGSNWQNTPIKVTVRHGLRDGQLSIDNLAPLLPWILPLRNAL